MESIDDIVLPADDHSKIFHDVFCNIEIHQVLRSLVRNSLEIASSKQYLQRVNYSSKVCPIHDCNLPKSGDSWSFSGRQ